MKFDRKAPGSLICDDGRLTHFMEHEEITRLFDRQAASYDQQWNRMAPLNGALHLLTGAVLADLPPAARVLCVGSGTGIEILHLAGKFPGWRFTAVEPSAAMMEVFRRKAVEQGILDRCTLHTGYLQALQSPEPFDAATAFLVSQFLLDRDQRSEFFRGIVGRLRPGGLLVSSDLACDMNGSGSRSLLEVWFRLMAGGGMPSGGLVKMREAYTRDVAVLPPEDVREIIMRGGFESPVRFFQAGMICAWYAKRSLNDSG